MPASLLTGLRFDEAGKRLVPTHATRAGRRYRHDVSQALLTGGKAKDPTGRRIPAKDIERLVTERRHAIVCRVVARAETRIAEVAVELLLTGTLATTKEQPIQTGRGSAPLAPFLIPAPGRRKSSPPTRLWTGTELTNGQTRLILGSSKN